MKTRGMLQKRKTKTMQTRIEAKLISFFTEVLALAWDNLMIYFYIEVFCNGNAIASDIKYKQVLFTVMGLMTIQHPIL